MSVNINRNKNKMENIKTPHTEILFLINYTYAFQKDDKKNKV